LSLSANIAGIVGKDYPEERVVGSRSDEESVDLMLPKSNGDFNGRPSTRTDYPVQRNFSIPFKAPVERVDVRWTYPGVGLCEDWDKIQRSLSD